MYLTNLQFSNQYWKHIFLYTSQQTLYLTILQITNYVYWLYKLVVCKNIIEYSNHDHNHKRQLYQLFPLFYFYVLVLFMKLNLLMTYAYLDGLKIMKRLSYIY